MFLYYTVFEILPLPYELTVTANNLEQYFISSITRAAVEVAFKKPRFFSFLKT